nr:hypothetical protein [Pseudobythopirellula maris]
MIAESAPDCDLGASLEQPRLVDIGVLIGEQLTPQNVDVVRRFDPHTSDFAADFDQFDLYPKPGQVDFITGLS